MNSLRVWRLAVRWLALVAGAISAYLLFGSLTGAHPPGCGPESGCDAVLGSRWAYWLGLPVSLGSVLTYSLVFWAAGRSPSVQDGWGTRVAPWVLQFAAVLVAGAAVWFVVLQWLVIRRFCPYCLTAHGAGLLMAILIGVRRPAPAGGLDGGMPAGWRFAGLFAGLVALAALVVGQVMYQPRLFQVEPLAEGTGLTEIRTNAGSGTNLPGRAISGESNPATVRAMPRELTLYGDQFRFDLESVPLLGRPDGSNVVVSLFDYTCRHCRELHGHLMGAYRALSNQLAIVCLPVPLDPGCNHLLKRPMAEHLNACVYASLGLAVWRADRAKAAEFDDWLFAPVRPPPTNQARAYAEYLVGSNALARALADPWIMGQIQTNISLYHTNYLRYRKGQLPQLIAGTNLLSGPVRSAADVYQLLSTLPGLRMPAGSAPAH